MCLSYSWYKGLYVWVCDYVYILRIGYICVCMKTWYVCIFVLVMVCILNTNLTDLSLFFEMIKKMFSVKRTRSLLLSL